MKRSWALMSSQVKLCYFHKVGYNLLVVGGSISIFIVRYIFLSTELVNKSFL